jgi:protein gp37
MGEKTGILWCDATWNPTTGCTKVSAGCLNCYAEKLALRLQKMGGKRYRNGFKLTLHEDALNLPMKWKAPKRIFVNSMSDLFHKDVPFSFVDEVWNVMLQTPRHTYQILTKRPERMAEYIKGLTDRGLAPLPNVWLGVSVEDYRYIGRIHVLRCTPATIRFVSFEPLIEDVGRVDLTDIHWAIVGGESGEGHRPIQKEWIENILGWCRECDTKFFFKQWGGAKPSSGGRLLNGQTYDEFPDEVAR